MALPATAKSHHTVWVKPARGRARPVRYAVDGERLVCFGDDGLADVPDGARVSLSIHEIAGGPAVADFSASLRALPPDAVDLNVLVEILGHVSLGRTIKEVRARVDEQRTSRRLVELVP
ncbi:MAG TPA: hypothetical protein VFF40_04650 [Acidimicrobiia bacterium]|nr:hypothetical protein [Acidimicrobiia bacterium]